MRTVDGVAGGKLAEPDASRGEGPRMTLSAGPQFRPRRSSRQYMTLTEAHRALAQVAPRRLTA